MNIPFLVQEPATLLCALCAVFYPLRYTLSLNRHDGRKGVIALLCLVGSFVTYAIANFEGSLIRTRYDLYILRIDELLHFGEPGVLMGSLLLPHMWGVWAINLVYGLLSAAVMWILFLYEPVADYREVWIAILANLAWAPLLYAAIPVSGPRFAFPHFPSIPVTAPHIIYLRAAPNGVPSVHFSTALLIWWYARGRRAPRIFASVFLLLTAITTLASGQHYVFDLIVAIPYAFGAIRFAHSFALEKVEEAGIICDPIEPTR